MLIAVTINLILKRVSRTTVLAAGTGGCRLPFTIYQNHSLTVTVVQ